MGLDSRRESCEDDPMPPEPPSRALYGILCFWRGLGSLYCHHPLLPFNCFLSLAVFISGQLWIKVFRAAAMIAVPFVHLGILYCSSQLDHEFFHHSLNSIRVITFWILIIVSIFFFQLHQAYGRFLREWLTTLQFPQGKEASGPGFGWTVCCLGPGASRQLN